MTTPLRIAFYSPRASHLEPELGHGGDPIFIEALFGALRERGHEVRVVSRLNVRDLWRGSIPARRLIHEAFRVRGVMRRFSPDACLVYNPSRTYPDVFGWWQRPTRYVLLNAHTWQSKRIPQPWRWLFELAFRQSLRRADTVIAFRPITAKRLRSFGVEDRQLQVIPPGVCVEPSLPSRIDARRRIGLSQAARVSLVVSRFTSDREASEQKTETVLELLDAFRELPGEAVLVVVGDGPGRPRIERTIVELGLAERVRLVGAVHHEELKWYFAACDVYAYPDLLDRPRLSVLEAQASGRPVVALRTGSAELTIDAGRTGLLAENLSEFRTHLAQLLGDRAQSAAMGEAAREYVVERHSIDVRATQVEKLLGAP
jgi:glycosyltransferase involved in cell wall biosynthesis